MILEFQQLRRLLRLRVDNPLVVDLIGGDLSNLTRDEYYGSIEMREQGIEWVFKEAPWVNAEEEVSDVTDLLVAGFHFHREGHDDYNEYLGHFPGGVVFGDTEEAVRHKLGEPTSLGGGEISQVLKSPLHRWIQYKSDDSFLRFQLDCDCKVEMVTLFVEPPWTLRGHAMQ